MSDTTLDKKAIAAVYARASDRTNPAAPPAEEKQDGEEEEAMDAENIPDEAELLRHLAASWLQLFCGPREEDAELQEQEQEQEQRQDASEELRTGQGDLQGEDDVGPSELPGVLFWEGEEYNALKKGLKARAKEGSAFPEDNGLRVEQSRVAPPLFVSEAGAQDYRAEGTSKIHRHVHFVFDVAG